MNSMGFCFSQKVKAGKRIRLNAVHNPETNLMG
jgi:hypothetical protein